MIELKVGTELQDKAWVLANAVLANSFNGGKHLLRCADGSYWAFNERLWQSTSHAALGKLLMIEAAKTQPSCANRQQLVSKAKKTSRISRAPGKLARPKAYPSPNGRRSARSAAHALEGKPHVNETRGWFAVPK